MFAIRLHAFGPPEALQLELLDHPMPGPGEVRIVVAAAGVHLLDTSLRRGEPGPFPAPPLPHVPGREVAGTIDALGPGVDPGWRGRAVVAHLGPASGGYASHAVVAIDRIHPVPDGLDPGAAVAMIGTGRTALMALDTADLRVEDVVLVTGAAGGMGVLLLQAANTAGAWVAGLAGSPAKAEVALDHGADAAVDVRATGWEGRLRAALGPRVPTVVFDGVGGAVGRTAFLLLGPGGRHVQYGWAAGSATDTRDAAVRGVEVRRLERPDALRPLEARALATAASGAWTPLVDRRFGLADAAAAHRALEGRGTTGKVVLTP